MSDFKQYLEDIGKLPDFRVDPSLTEELVRRMRLGDKKAELRLIESTLKFISELTVRHCKKWKVWPNYLDLVQEANFQVTAKISEFDPEKASLEDFVSFRARVAFIRFWYKTRPVRFTEHWRRTTRLLKQVQNLLSKKIGRAPTIEELSGHLEIDKEKILEFQSHADITISELNAFDEVSEGIETPKIDKVRSAARDPAQLAEIAEVYQLLIQSIGRLGADILLTHERFGTEEAQQLYLIRTGNRMSHQNMRQHAHRLKMRAIRDIQKKMRVCVFGGNYGIYAACSQRSA